jgi:hypothetical protein
MDAAPHSLALISFKNTSDTRDLACVDYVSIDSLGFKSLSSSAKEFEHN